MFMFNCPIYRNIKNVMFSWHMLMKECGLNNSGEILEWPII